MTDKNWGDSSIEWVRLGDIHRDQSVNTRPVDTAWVERQVCDVGFDRRKFGVLTVSHRTGGKLPASEYVVLDGQNRIALALEAGVPEDTKVQVVVFSGLTRAQEAAIFLGLNDGRTVAPLYKFLGRVAAQEPAAVEIVRILESHRWVVRPGNNDGYAQAVTAYDAVFRLDAKGYVLDTTVAVITNAWGHKSAAMRSVLIKGVAAVIGRYGSDLSLSQLVDRLKSYKGGAVGLYADAKGLHAYRGGSIASAVSEVIVNAYNKGRKSATRVDDWR